jgi:hypothetical protein
MIADHLFNSIGAIIIASALGFITIPFTHKKESYFYFIILGCVFWLSTAPVLIPGEVPFYLWVAVIPTIAAESAASALIYSLIRLLRKLRTKEVQPVDGGQ